VVAIAANTSKGPNVVVVVFVDVFEMVVNINELAHELVNQELLIFHRFYVNAKYIKCLLEWWRKHETMFPTIDFLARKMLRIVSSQIETNNFFFLVGFVTKFRICRLHLNNFERLIFVNKNWPNDVKVGCKAPSNLVD
jgi:hypothetical protein